MTKSIKIEDDEIMDYVVKELLSESENRHDILEAITAKKVLEWLREEDGGEMTLEDILDTEDKDEIAEYLNDYDSTTRVAGYYVIQSDNLAESQKIEEFIKSLGK